MMKRDHHPAVRPRTARREGDHSYIQLAIGASKMMGLLFFLLLPGAYIGQNSPLAGGLLALGALFITAKYGNVVKARAGF